MRTARWEAEGMAMAAARELRQTADQDAALRAARDWAIRNDVDPSRIECCEFSDLRPLAAPDGNVDTVTAASRATQDTFFLHLFGAPETVSVKRAATAQVVGAEGGPICPWGVIGDPSDLTPGDGSYFGIVPGRVYAIDLSAAPEGQGDFLPLDLTETGVAGYQDMIADGCRESASRGLVGWRLERSDIKRERCRAFDTPSPQRSLLVRIGRWVFGLPEPEMVRHRFPARQRKRGRRPCRRLQPLSSTTME